MPGLDRDSHRKSLGVWYLLVQQPVASWPAQGAGRGFQAPGVPVVTQLLALPILLLLGGPPAGCPRGSTVWARQAFGDSIRRRTVRSVSSYTKLG